MENITIDQVISLILAEQSDDANRYIGFYVDEDEDVETQQEQVEDNLVKIIRDYADDKCTSDYCDMPEYYTIDFEEKTVAFEINDGSVTIIDDCSTAKEAMEKTAHDWSDYSIAEVLAFYGVIADEKMFDLADENDKNVQIWAKYYYYDGHLGGKSDGWVLGYDVDRNHGSDVAIFDTYQDAQKWIAEEWDNINMLPYGMYARPDFYICK